MLTSPAQGACRGADGRLENGLSAECRHQTPHTLRSVKSGSVRAQCVKVRTMRFKQDGKLENWKERGREQPNALCPARFACELLWWMWSYCSRITANTEREKCSVRRVSVTDQANDELTRKRKQTTLPPKPVRLPAPTRSFPHSAHRSLPGAEE